MDSFSKMLNELLVNTFHSILKLEEDASRSISGNRLSISELHMLEAIRKEEVDKGRTITDLAQDLSITPPSVTVAINKLTEKGYVIKERGRADGRQVHVLLTEEGRRAEAAHRFFHRQMVQNIARDFKEEEREILLKGLQNLKAFFESQEEKAQADDGPRQERAE